MTSLPAPKGQRPTFPNPGSQNSSSPSPSSPTPGSPGGELLAKQPAQGQSSMAISHVNPLYDAAFRKHIDKLREDEKDAFLEARKHIAETSLLSDIKTLDEAHEQTSNFRGRTGPIQKFFALLDRFLGGVSIGTGCSPEISSIVVGGIRLIIDLAKNFLSFFDRLSEMLCRFGDFLDPLAEYAKSAKENASIRDALDAVYGDILEFCRHARRVFVDLHEEKRKFVSVTVFFKSLWEPFEEEFGNIRSNMDHHLQVLDHTASASTTNQAHFLSLSEKERREREQRKEKEDFLKWISSTSHEERHRAVYEKRHPGTGDWFLQRQEFQEWLDKPISSLLWCHGKLGAGKSVLASNVIEAILEKYAPDPTVGICFAYYDYTKSSSQDFAQIVLSLIKQLCQKSTIPDAFMNAKRNADPPSAIGDQHHFSMSAQNFKELFILIDALDECPKEERSKTFRFIKEALNKTPLVQTRIFVTSRRESDINLELENLRAPTIQLEAQNVAADVEAYVRSEVQSLRSGLDGKKLYVADERLVQKIISTLTEKADGMFLWVNLQLRHLCESSERRKDKYVKEALGKLPSGLDNTYRKIWQQIQDSNESMKELALRSLAWVFYAQRPLTIREFCSAVAVTEASMNTKEPKPEPENWEAIRSACANLIELEDGPLLPSRYQISFQSRVELVRPIHYSVQEFFTKAAQSESGIFQCFYQPHVQQILATSCINELQFMPSYIPAHDAYDFIYKLETAPFL
ncbi:uncharacterized protein K452DRAFT_22926 [Aplosporella prunicola CBS 121167]|uniref:NACHT domain-containing protein n=1 Tax=Aplosporella prunicola CBS 121167 TaxID=1176127 RepID=A0A6A6ATS3_9PEZI|nr:uncharacterized protein K452DRAFT_22926 [Aplosporella prunicola CBS 121167]KAF2135412.1 hypothetical protein K452DRAFT_22926 [Aplosporella prunicola CBS 121167]